MSPEIISAVSVASTNCTSWAAATNPNYFNARNSVAEIVAQLVREAS